MKPIVLFCVAVLLIAVSGCGQSSSPGERESGTATLTASPTAPAPTDGPTITIAGMGFSSAVTVAPGAQVTIVNDDEVEHSVTSRTEGQFDVHVEGKQRATLTAPSEPGEYAFYCIYHPAMKGTLIVE